jgi:hypothetical protein
MKRNYLLVYHNKYTDEIKYRYFETKEDMKDFIKVNLSQRRYWKVLHKYEIKEVK